MTLPTEYNFLIQALGFLSSGLSFSDTIGSTITVGTGTAGKGIEGGRLSVIGSPRASAFIFEDRGTGVVSFSERLKSKVAFSSTGVLGGEGEEAELEGVLAWSNEDGAEGCDEYDKEEMCA